MVATIPPPQIRNVAPKQNVKEFINGKRASGSAAQTTVTGLSGQALLTVGDTSSYLPGHGVAVVGGGAAHGLSAPANCFAIPRTTYQTAPLSSSTRSLIPVTADATADCIFTPNAIDSRVALLMPNGEGVRFVTSNTLPGGLSEGTTYYIRQVPQTFTLQMQGTPTGGTLRLYSYYDRRNGECHVQEDPQLYVDIPYNASAATFQAAIRLLPGWGQVTATISVGSAPNATYSVTMTGVPGDQLVSPDITGLTGGTPYYVLTNTQRGQVTLYDTPAHAIAGGGTGLVNITSTGTGTHWIYRYGGRTYEFQAAGLSGNGGVTAASSAFSTAVGPHELDEFSQIALFCDKVGKGIVWYGDGTSNKKVIAVMNGLTNIRRVAVNVSGFTSFKESDIGKTFTDGTGSGIIEGFDNTSRNVWVSTSYTFPTNGATLTTTSGTGGGTQNGASVVAMMYLYSGKRFKREYNYYAGLQRRAGYKYYPGELMEKDGLLYRAIQVRAARRTAADVVVTLNTSTDTFALPNTDNLSSATTGCPVYLRGSVALPEISGGRLQEGTTYYARLTGSGPMTFTLHPTSGDASANTNKIDLTGAEVGTLYMYDGPIYPTTLGATVWDGDVLFRRENCTFPAAPSATAAQDTLIANVVSKTASTLTIDTNLTTSVTLQLLLHDDLTSLLAHTTNGLTTNRTLYYPYGEYNCVTRTPASESRAYQCIYNTLQYLIFRFNSNFPVTWEGEEGTRITHHHLDYTADLNDDTEKVMTLLAFGYGGFTSKGLEYSLWGPGVPVCERPDAEARYHCFNTDGDGTAGGGQNAGGRFVGPKFYNGGFSGWASVGAVFWYTDRMYQEIYKNMFFYSGGNNHDAMLYTNGGSFEDCAFIGIRGENSQHIYQDAARGNWLNFHKCYFERSRKDGIAIRCSEARVSKCTFVDCVKIFAREITKGLLIEGCDLWETAIYPNNASNAYSDVRISDCRLVDSYIGVDTYSKNVMIDGIQILITARPRLYTTTEQVCFFKGEGQDIQRVVIDNRAWQFDMRSVQFGGNGSSRFTKVRVINSAVDWCTFTTSGSGPKWFTECEFYSYYGASAPCLTQHTGDSWWTRCKFDARSGSGGNPYLFSSGGRTTFSECENNYACTFNNSITGPLYMRRNDWKNGTIVVSKDGAILEENNFATAPTLSGALIYQKNNRLADVAMITVGSPFAASINDQALGVADIWVFTLTGNQNATGFVALANGTKKTLVNGDGTDTATFKHLVTSSSTNQIRTPGGTDFAVGPGARCTLERANDIWYVY